ncbi:MAG: AAA family ATPase [Mariniphaga sp.]|nr:AAA family ATPase [Mariniphaga sp.]
MSITNYIPYTPTTGQWVALQKLGVFFESNEYHVFVFQGYAGTGKTTLLKGVLDYLDSVKRPYRLMASTGRAARVLTNKTRYSYPSKCMVGHCKIYTGHSARWV